MGPSFNLDINQIIADTQFMKDLNKVLYGAELALRRTNADDAVTKDVLGYIVKNSFASLVFDFSHENETPSGAGRQREPDAPAAAGGLMVYKEAANAPSAYQAPDSAIENQLVYSGAIDSARANASGSSGHGRLEAGIDASDIDIVYDLFANHPFKPAAADQGSQYRAAEKTYDSHMDDDEDFEKPIIQAFQRRNY